MSTEKKPMSEEKIQSEFVKNIEPYVLSGRIKMTAIPNSTYTPSFTQINKNTRMGVRKGLLDMFFIIGSEAFFIEFKTAIGVLTPEQVSWIQALSPTPIKTFVCRTSKEAETIIDNYLKVDKKL